MRGSAENGAGSRPTFVIDRREMVALGLFVAVALALLYVVLPELGGVKHTWDRLSGGDAWWIGVAAALELASMAAYVAIFHGVHVPPGSPITRADSYKITMASLAATRLLAAGGAGGVALTAWSLRRSGMARREVATRMIAFLVLLYGVYVGAMVICGVLLYTGLLAGPHPFAITIGPAIFGVVAIALFAVVAFLPASMRERLDATASRLRQARGPKRLIGRLAAAPASLVAGIRFAMFKARHPDLALAGTVAWWTLNIAVLYASFRAFGQAPPVGVVVQAYLVGMLANLLPLPGGIGGVDGGMIGAAVALGVGGSVAVMAVLTYRLFAFWLPSVPGTIAYFQLRRTVGRWGGGQSRDRPAPLAARPVRTIL